MAVQYHGVLKVTSADDAEGYRTYTMVHRINSTGDAGPQEVRNCADLPQTGDPFEYKNDFDEFATCQAAVTVEPASQVRNGPTTKWDVTQTFTNKPLPPNQQRCQDSKNDDPMQEPPKITFGTAQTKEEASLDRFGQRILTSSHEVVRGEQNTWPIGMPKFTIEQNYPILERALCQSMVNGVNFDWIWDYPPRTVRLVDFSADKLYYGSCYLYFKRKFSFEVNWRTWDRDLLDEGTKVLKGHFPVGTSGTGTALATWILDDIDGGPPDPDNPAHFIRFQDRHGNMSRVVLDGEGKPASRVELSSEINTITNHYGAGLIEVITEIDYDLEFEEDDEVQITGSDPSFFDGKWIVDEVLSTNHVMLRKGEGTAPLPSYFIDDGEGGWMTNLDAGSGKTGNIHVEKFFGVDFLVLGLPIDLEA